MLKRKLEWLLCGFLVILILSIALSFVWYKSFCRVDQVINWNAVSAISGIVMALFTIVAIFIAIYIPQKDRITSSKIQLFSQRFETYCFIHTNFKRVFDEGHTQFDNDELLKLGLRSEFLISKQDNSLLGKITLSINNKISQKFYNKSNPDNNISINEELDLLDKIFEKYLNLRDYGVE